MDNIRVMLADDNLSLLRALTESLSRKSEIEVVAAVSDGAAILAGCAHEENAQAFIRFILGEDVQRRVQTEYARESVLTSLSGDSMAEEEFCAYDIEWAAAHQKDILASWQALMQEDAP